MDIRLKDTSWPYFQPLLPLQSSQVEISGLPLGLRGVGKSQGQVLCPLSLIPPIQ